MHQPTDIKPWYRQFWVWLVIAIPAVSVLSGLVLVFIAVTGSDDLVVDNYYKQGKAINQVLDQGARARELSLGAALTFRFASNDVQLSLAGQGELPAQLRLALLHPIEADFDQTILLEAIAPGSYRAKVSGPLHHRYHLRLSPADGEQWRLNGSIDFERSHEAVLMAE